MTKQRNVSLHHDGHITSAGSRLGDVPEFARHDVEWMDGVHGTPAMCMSLQDRPI